MSGFVFDNIRSAVAAAAGAPRRRHCTRRDRGRGGAPLPNRRRLWVGVSSRAPALSRP